MRNLLSILPLVLAACSGSDADFADAFGNFEAREVTVSAEASGRILHMAAREGEALSAGAVAVVIDSVQLVLQREQVEARLAAARSRFPGIAAQEQVLKTQLEVARRELDRVEALLDGGAATTKQRDDLEGQIRVLEGQLAAIRTGNAPVFAELDLIRAQMRALEDQITRTRLRNPIAGTVLLATAEPGELAAPGRPLYRIAPLDTLDLRAYVGGDQLGSLALGQEVGVVVDGPDGTLIDRTGRVSWIASEAEFTPKLIQTREERVSLVYAFKVRVPNPDGVLKIGMPAEVRFR